MEPKKRKCWWCRQVIEGKSTKDHVFPRSSHLFAGKKSNKVPSCQPCNSDKGYMHPWDWIQLLEDRGFEHCDELREWLDETFPGGKDMNLWDYS